MAANSTDTVTVSLLLHGRFYARERGAIGPWYRLALSLEPEPRGGCVEHLELLGAPRAWLWVVLGGSAIAIPTLFRGFIRRGKGSRHEKRFWLQRAPQLAAGINLFLVSCAFEAIEFVLGTGEPAFAKSTFSASREYLPLPSLALVLPPLFAGIIAWGGVFLSAAGLALLVSGWLALGSSFSPDAEIVHGQQVAPLFLRRAKYEESLLIQEFGEVYLAYARRLGWRRLVPVFIPFGV